VLLVFLAIAAALSSYFVTDADPAADAQSAPATEGTETQAAAAPVAPAPVTPAPVTPTVVTPTPASPAPEAATAPQAVADAGPAPAEGEPAAAAPVVDATDMAATVAPDSGMQDEITLSSAETAPQAVDAVALPVPGARGDPPPAAQVPPPPFGTVYQFDENGLIRPTPEGIVSPEGVLLVAGRPAQVPPPRPEGLAPAPAADAAAAAPEAATGFPADPALADARPQARPAGLPPAPAPEPAPETATQAAPEDETNLIPAAARFVSLRPPARPDAILAAGLQAQQAALAASASLAAPDPNRSVLALSVSRRPAARPADMARAVEAAVAAAARQPEPEPEPEPAPEPDPPAEITPETEEEPELAGAAPAIPATANVARQATMRNVIDLGDLNLIGIYGTQSDRYALVRQPNGRFVKVRVGDRLDGGRVAAITASEVRYEKRGRMQVLEMPRG
jgi:type IV pilus biogenesis protein PilP